MEKILEIWIRVGKDHLSGQKKLLDFTKE
ncbi:hypothetical protein HID58_079860 [Brassica napus]|uniref:Uncharacterized protein n=1 Tax=Brassica napus TaxID=3708 RepID=A0ABQ7Y4I4_BRANA|nr:hypothetical protein HID58_079860 [Brassica napus]